ncbi:dihydrolipoamide acetyltransferase family protein [Erythrobacter sp. HL-111]|uniref:dihydrolipoamide acetyltransferase family protein n=1 Tax=Erythrobacter sp. HL-111 TaxID=1798193 RepID=UPI0006DAF251|nr:dihydrolipoamide acetyltransferase family protein [Erythrobacter sp. HL-111]KPP90271.1 MAG: 2-oxoisovalerate dehydrogenase E2 component (dihydrolipoyl transacylase) BkdB [Erythrobacteraceae bacterium HL-111]SDR85795.1 2-oxoisovalerate dehydrogenase E2 component (dihydrolipoyl transacylase) [Erythrobacter sp. HL-111]
MAKFTFNMPDVGEGVAEAEIVEWHVKAGDLVEEDQHLVDVMTDKATIDIESPVAGKVLEVAGEIGETIAVGAMLLVIEVEGEASANEAEAAAERIEDEMSDADGADAAPVPAAVAERIEVENPDASDADDAIAAGPKPAPAPSPAPAPTPEPKAEAKVLASPAVRKRAKDLGIDLAEVRPAEDGRVRHGDLDQFLAYNSQRGFSPAGAVRADEEIRVIGLRKRIAQNMAASKRHIPHFTYVEECDVTALEALRADLNANRGSRPKLTLLPLLITAFCRLVPDFPMINARYDDEAGVVTRAGSVHLGMATQTDAGLMVPVIRDAQARNLWQLASEIARLAEAARNGSAKSEELSGSTLTVTSLGPLGGVATTPVINRPEVAIIGPNRIVERPMFVPDGQGGERIEKRKLMNISISCDHRVVDGYDAARFVQEVKRLIETPVLLLQD